jgi:hypothetical protein
MEQKLTDEQISNLCMYMRVIDLLKSRPDLLDENPEMKKQLEMICSNVDKVMESISDEQRDEVLEAHKMQLEEIAQKEARKQAKKQKKSASKSK